MQKEPWYQNESLRALVLREGASWRKMYPVQPPARLCMVLEGGGCTDVQAMGTVEVGTVNKAFEHLQAPGVRMGLIYDIIIQRVEWNDGASVSIEWRMFNAIWNHWAQPQAGQPKTALTEFLATESERNSGNGIAIFVRYGCGTCWPDDSKYNNDFSGLRVPRLFDDEWEYEGK